MLSRGDTIPSPASSIVAPNSIHTKLEQDIIVNGNYLGQAATHTSTSLLGSVINDFTGHSIVKTYLGRGLVREYSTDDDTDSKSINSNISQNQLLNT